MICTRCGTVQRRKTAKFCHQCGALIEPAAVDVQPDSPEISIVESVPQQAQPFKSIALLPREPDGSNTSEAQPLERRQQESPGFGEADNRTDREYGIGDGTVKAALMTSRDRDALEVGYPPLQPTTPTVDYPAWEEPPAPMDAQQVARHAAGRTTRDAHSQPLAWPQEHPSAKGQLAPFPMPQNRRTNPARTAFEMRDEIPAARHATSAERPIRSSARGPVPGSLSRPRSSKRRRHLPLGIAITVGLLLVFVLAGFGLYAVLGAGPQEPSAWTSYIDPGHHFSIQYPTVWLVKKPTNNASGVRFTDATDTAELWVTYTPTTPNLTEEQFADQEAASAGIATPAPGTDTFAGATWIMRTGIVTLTSGISQQILLYITTHKNLFFEVREVAPLNNYSGPNQTIFMPMLTKYFMLL